MRRSKYSSISLILIAIFTFTMTAVAQDASPAATKLKLNRITIPEQLDGIARFRDVHLTSATSGTALIEACIDEATRVCTMLLANNGSTRLLDTLDTEFDSYPFTSVVWVDGAPPSQPQEALLFLSDISNGCSLSSLYIAKYNSEGIFTQQAVKLFELPKDKGTYAISLSSLRATRGPSSVAVAATFMMQNYMTGKRRTIAKFFETDFDGGLIGAIRDVPFDEFDNQQAASFAPAWSGKKWLVPYRLFANDGQGSKCCLAKAVSATSASADEGKIVLTPIFKGGIDESVSGSSHFLMQPSSRVEPAGKSSLYMHLRVENEIAAGSKKLTDWRYKSSVITFNAKGAREKVRTLQFDIWDRAKVAEQGWILVDYSEFLSAFVSRYDGGYIVARGDRIDKYREGHLPPTEFASTGRIGLLAIASNFKKVKEIAWCDLDAPEMPNGNPMLCRDDGHYILIADTIDSQNHKSYFYISIFSY